MALEPRQRTISMGAGVDSRAGVDEGLRRYMLRVYNYMTLGLALTGVVAFAVANTPALLQLFYAQTAVGIQPTILAYIAMFSPLAFVLVLSFGINKLSTPAVQALFWAFAAVMGLSLTHIFIVYTGASIARVFFITASMFAAMSLYGYTTKKDLSGWGSFLLMGLIGVIIAMVVNIFLQSAMMEFVISIIGVLVFVGFTAYDTQRIKSEYNVNDSGAITEKRAVYGALSLYLDFINIFLFLLHLFGSRE
ncbi:MAG: BAX inhibitor (BI)-1/YccA family protein [Alphaproteobacteria bacterium]|nr:BAX inhibitor (BI)-1/YccA family protein [Alphaproteobacteria bacterium]